MKTITSILILTAIFLAACTDEATNPNPSTQGSVQKIYGAVDDQSARYFKELSDGGYAIAGNYGSNIMLVRTDVKGAMLWSATYTRSGQDALAAMDLTNDNGFIICGTSKLPAGNEDVLLIKAASDGSVQWSKLIGDQNPNSATGLMLTADNNYLVCGSSKVSANDYDAFVIKVSAAGNIIWAMQYSSVNDEFFTGITERGGNYAIGGYASGVTGQVDMNLTMLNTSGNVITSKSIGSTADDFCNNIQPAPDGYYLGGFNITSFAYNTLIFKVDNSGNAQWSNLYDIGGDEFLSGMSLLNGGGLIISGYYKPLTSPTQAMLAKIFPDGTVQWSKILGGTNDDIFAYAEETAARGIAACGYINNYAYGGRDFYFVRIEQNGIGCGTITNAGLGILPVTVTTTTVSMNEVNANYTVQDAGIVNSNMQIQEKTLCSD